MDTSYRFLSDREPTDEQLEGLMDCVLQDVKERATLANEKFKEHQEQLIKIVFEKRKTKYSTSA
jgi:hypothetical protein